MPCQQCFGGRVCGLACVSSPSLKKEEKMKRVLVAYTLLVLMLGAALIGCSESSPVPTKSSAATPVIATVASAAVPATTAPIQTPTVQPAPTKQTSFPGNKPITFLLHSAAGGSSDTGIRMLAPYLEKELGTSVQVTNKAGAGGQLAYTELVQAKPDGYVIGSPSLPQIITIYLDPERKAIFSKKSFTLLAMHVIDPGVIAVKADSRFKTVQDIIEEAKVNPGKLISCDSGILSDDHLAMLQLQKLTGIKLSPVHVDGAAPGMTALLGGHVDLYFGNIGDTLSQMKAGQIRVLGVMDKSENPMMPGIKTMESQGTKLYSAGSRTIAAPAGVPKEVVDILSGAIKRAMAAPELKAKMEEQGLTLSYMSPEQLDAYWTDMEEQVKPLMALAKE